MCTAFQPLASPRLGVASGRRAGAGYDRIQEYWFAAISGQGRPRPLKRTVVVSFTLAGDRAGSPLSRLRS